MTPGSTIGIKTVYAIIAQAVEDFPRIECLQPNTFSTITDYSILSVDNLEKNYNDFQNGFFWSRHWVGQGASINNQKFSYPVVGIEHESFGYQDWEKGFGCHTFSLMFIDQYDCQNCPKQCHRTNDQVSIDMFRVAKGIIKELSTYNLYHAVIDGAETFLWLSEGRYEAERANFDNDFGSCRSLSAHISIQSELYKVERGLPNNTTAWAVKVRVCACEEEEMDFHYEHVNPKRLATTLCSSCR